MTSDIDEDFASTVKRFTSTGGRGGQASSTLHDVRHHIADAATHAQKAVDHSDQSAQHSATAAVAKSGGDRVISSLHSDAAEQHSELSSLHTALAAKHLQRAKAGSSLHEGFGGRELDPETLYKPFDHRRKVDYTPVAPRNQHFTVKDLRRVVEAVCAEHHSSLQVLRFDDEGFLGQVTSVAGMYPGTSPSCTQLEQDFVKKIRTEHPTATVELLDQTTIPPFSPGSYSSRKSVWRFCLKNGADRGGF
jgi:hypothetical protein